MHNMNVNNRNEHIFYMYYKDVLKKVVECVTF